jgi:hypothetical protein
MSKARTPQVKRQAIVPLIHHEARIHHGKVKVIVLVDE